MQASTHQRVEGAPGMITAEVLESLGVRVAKADGRELLGYCPVHHLKEGTEQHKPKWYMNAETGAWICFTCGQRGSLPYLVQALGGDPDSIEHLLTSAAVVKASRWVLDRDGNEVEERVMVDPVLFDAHPRPPQRVLDLKDVDEYTVARYNARWDPRGKCWMLPIYSFDNQLLGWQEKSKGYFKNVPDGVAKSEALFGWHTYRSGPLVVVESPLDAIRFASYGHPAVATMGSYVSEMQTDHLATADRLVLAFDNDDAGDHATEHVSSVLKNHPHLRFFQYPRRSRGTDPGELPPRQLLDGVERATIIPPSSITKENDQEWNPQKRRPRRQVKVW